MIETWNSLIVFPTIYGAPAVLVRGPALSPHYPSRIMNMSEEFFASFVIPIKQNPIALNNRWFGFGQKNLRLFREFGTVEPSGHSQYQWFAYP